MAGSGRTMPGKVLKILVKPGDLVAKGADLLVTEAMKMETSVRSPKHAVVEEILVHQGDAVEAGDLLVACRPFKRRLRRTEARRPSRPLAVVAPPIRIFVRDPARRAERPSQERRSRHETPCSARLSLPVGSRPAGLRLTPRTSTPSRSAPPRWPARSTCCRGVAETSDCPSGTTER